MGRVGDMRRETHSRGAALIIVVAILAVLFLVSAYFYTSSRRDLRAATNTVNALRAKFASDAGMAMAVSMLQNDQLIHPTATSLDHGWNTFFNGAWLARKPWAFPGTATPASPWSNNGIPYIDYEDIVNLDRQVTVNWNALRQPAGLPEALPIHDALYVPRVQAAPDDVTGGFAIDYSSPDFVLQIDSWADVDNDGDGFKDSMWIPVPVEEFFGGKDKDEDPAPRTNPPYIANESGDGIDNDLDYAIVGTNGIDDDGDGEIDEIDEGIDEPGEIAYFVYWGGNDGLDNDNDGDVDDADEQKLFLTAPLMGVIRNGNDDDGNDLIDDDAEAVELFSAITVQINAQALQEFAGNPAGADYGATLDPNPGSADVDQIDNDYSLIVNEARGLAFQDASDPQNLIKSYNRIDTVTYNDFASGLDNSYTITAYGEAVCSVGGRVAVQIVDEASKVNLNAAVGLAVGPRPSIGADNLLTWAFSEGAGVHEYDLRTVPNIGRTIATNVAQFRAGAAHGNSGIVVGNSLAFTGNAAQAALTLDTAFPGYGGVDDNGSALWMMLDGLDNDGDAPAYQTNNVDDNGDGVVDDPREGIDELWEGIDEPQEFQWFRPLRDRVAESDSVDNNGNDVIDEIGELGDRYYQTRDQVLDVDSIGEATLVRTQPLLTVHSSDLNERFQRYYRNEYTGANPDPFQYEFPQTSGLKLDFNYALADSVAVALDQDWDYPDTPGTWIVGLGVVPLTEEMRLFAQGLRREDATVVGTPYGNSSFGPTIVEADAELRALQLGLNIQDSRDTDHIRSEHTNAVFDAWWRDVTDAATPGVADDGEERSIVYTQSGVEGIRINEIMVRPVRRVEAEAVANIHAGTSDPDYDANLDPNHFTYLHGLLPGDTGILWDFNMEALTIDDDLGGAWTPQNTPPGTVTPILWEQDGAGYLGPRTYLRTNSSDATDTVDVIPNVIQFRFGPSAQLPPGRYYLMFNSMGPRDDGTFGPTVAAGGQIEWVVKYARARGVGNESDILEDIEAYIVSVASGDPEADLLVDPSRLFDINEEAIAGRKSLDALDGTYPLSGWVMLPTTASAYDTATKLRTTVDYDADRYDGYGLNAAHSIVIPPYDDPTADENGDGNPANDQEYLYLAMRIAGSAGGEDNTVSVNFFDFSQEPDHEWIEIVNVAQSENPIDLSGWTLQVGGDPENSRMLYIPNDVQIAPGGSLLLVTDKYDIGAEAFDDPVVTDVPYVQRNGIGMVRGPVGGDLETISEPPIPNLCGTFFLASLYTGVGSNVNEPIGPSVFRRIIDRDFVDRDGKGVEDVGGPDDRVASTSDALVEALINKGFPTPAASAVKAWDRIVQLDSDVHDPPAGSPLDTIARWVLGGGIFPNYPEENMVDDDGDDAALTSDGIDNNGNRYTFDHDGLDNDNDGLIDEGADGVDNNGNGAIDEPIESEGVDEISLITGLGEGVDEGAFLREAWMFYDADGVDNDGDGLVDEGADGIENNGDGVIDDAAESEAFGVAVPGSFSLLPVDFGLGVMSDYLTSQNVFGNPFWKEFIERRFFPGDSVAVTLYVGARENGHIADRVTYTQRDVENASIDDGAPCPYVDDSGTAATGDDFGATLNRVLGSTLWPDNTMGVDFYRSLERKHPLYAGDRFGTQNRWSATDGNYDDWSPGTNRWIATYDPLLVIQASASRLDAAVLGGTPLPLPTETSAGQTNARLFAHGFSGSPLRMNFTARVLENPLFTLDGDRQFYRVADNTLFNDLVHLNVFEQRNLWSYRMAKVRNAAFASPGDLMNVPHMTMVQDLLDTSRGVLGAEGIKPRGNAFILGRDFRGDGVLLGQDFPKDLRAVLDSATIDSISLSAGQAVFHPLFPSVVMVTSNPALGQWTEPSVPGAMYTPPRAWTPSYLFNLAGDAAAVTPTLFENAPLFTGTSEAALFDRWPAVLRTVMYSSSNPGKFVGDPARFEPTLVVRETQLNNPAQLAAPTDLLPDDEYPAEALLVWDGDDGLPNGQYDVYVSFANDFANLRNVEATELTAFAKGLALADEAEIFRNIAVDIAVLTDTNGDRKCWTDGGGFGTNATIGGPDTHELGVMSSPALRPENFGLKTGLVPSTDGIVHYGVVTVENNYLALFLRNWSEPGQIVNFARVILTPRDRTVGRVNVNTVVTRLVEYDDGSAPFNSLLGLPGILGVYTPETVNTTTNERVPSVFNPRPFPDADNINPGVANSVRALAVNRIAEIAVQRGRLGYPDFGELPGTYIATERFDGRYYLTPSELVVRGDNLPEGLRGLELYPGILNVRNSDGADNNGDGLTDEGADGIDNNGNGFVDEPLEWEYDADPATRFDEIKKRYSRVAGSITSRSDTFEIVVTAQSGVGIDGNRDGVINWRDNGEFEVFGERKTRTVYER